MDLSVIIVNWNVRDLLRDCLTSLLTAAEAAPHLDIEIIVVDSASHDGSVEMVRAEFPQLTLIASEENLGYARGNNVGAQAATGRYLFLLNPDTIVAADALALMVACMDGNARIGALGPRLEWPDGSLQSSRRRFPTLGSLFWESTLLGQWQPDNRHIRRYHMRDIAPQETRHVDWVVGAAILIRREAWAQVGPIDDQTFFMYFEETDWCRRCVEAGWQVHYLHAARVTHYEGKSSEQIVAARTIRFQRSKLQYTAKYFGRGWAMALRLFLWSCFALQWLEETAKWLVGHRRALRRERMLAYSHVLREL